MMEFKKDCTICLFVAIVGASNIVKIFMYLNLFYFVKWNYLQYNQPQKPHRSARAVQLNILLLRSFEGSGVWGQVRYQVYCG